LYRNVCILYTCIYTYIQQIYTSQEWMSTSGIILQSTEWGCQTPNPPKIHCFKGEFCVQFVWYFQKQYPGIKQDLPVVILYIFKSYNIKQKYLEFNCSNQSPFNPISIICECNFDLSELLEDFFTFKLFCSPFSSLLIMSNFSSVLSVLTC
jgi:hypothetical protein